MQAVKHSQERKENYVGRGNPASIKEKRIPRADAPCIPFTKRTKKKKSMGIRRVTSSSPCLILLMRVKRSLLKSASGETKEDSKMKSMAYSFVLAILEHAEQSNYLAEGNTVLEYVPRGGAMGWFNVQGCQ
eukprot:677819-Pelagomonas_calceolata.AAC.1